MSGSGEGMSSGATSAVDIQAERPTCSRRKGPRWAPRRSAQDPGHQNRQSRADRQSRDPIVATGVRLIVPASGPGGGAAVDELEVHGAREQARMLLRGDCNGDGGADLSDAICALEWLFLGSAKPDCAAALDTNGDGSADISDPVALLGHLFLGGAFEVAEPREACDADPTADSLVCVGPSICP